MGTTLLVHILAASLGLAAGYAALFAAKGARLHRTSGTLFVYAMLVMGITATVLSVARSAGATALGGLMVVYLVMTALTTVRPPTAASRRLDVGLMLMGFALAAWVIAAGSRALASPGGTTDAGVPGAAILVNGVIALLASVGDVRAIRAGGLRGGPRLARHLWRMCFALWMAAGSFFLGQADELPRALRIYPLLAVPAVFPLLAMAYWLWRVRGRKPLRPTPAGAPRRVPPPAGVPAGAA